MFIKLEKNLAHFLLCLLRCCRRSEGARKSSRWAEAAAQRESYSNRQGGDRDRYGGDRDNKFGDSFRRDGGGRDKERTTIPASQVQESDIPTTGPFKAILTNISFNATEDDIGEWIIDNKVDLDDLKLNMGYDGKFRGSCSAFVKSADSLRDLLALDGKELLQRSIRVSLPGPERSERRNDRYGGGESFPERGAVGGERKKLNLAKRTLPVEARVEPTARKSITPEKEPVKEKEVKRTETGRKKIELKPRSEAAKAAAEAEARPSSIFGDAKPVDVKDVYTRKVDAPKKENSAERSPSVEKGNAGTEKQAENTEKAAPKPSDKEKWTRDTSGTARGRASSRGDRGDRYRGRGGRGRGEGRATDGKGRSSAEGAQVKKAPVEKVVPESAKVEAVAFKADTSNPFDLLEGAE